MSGKNPDNGRYEVFTAAGENVTRDKNDGMKMVYKKLFSAGNKISAAAGDGKTTFIAMDKLVVSSVTGLDKAEGFFKHSKETITGLAYDINAGFFTAPKGVACREKRQHGIFSRINLSIALSGGKLHVYIPAETAVVQVDNIGEFKGYALK